MSDYIEVWGLGYYLGGLIFQVLLPFVCSFCGGFLVGFSFGRGRYAKRF